MSVPAATYRVFRPDPRSLGAPEEHHRGRFSACHLPPESVLVTVQGDVDATNSQILADYVERQSAGARHLVLDLTAVDFFGTAGFAALHNIGMMCSRYGVTWALLAGARVRRLIRICGPDSDLPLAKPQSVAEQLHAGTGDGQLLIGWDH